MISEKSLSEPPASVKNQTTPPEASAADEALPTGEPITTLDRVVWAAHMRLRLALGGLILVMSIQTYAAIRGMITGPVEAVRELPETDEDRSPERLLNPEDFLAPGGQAGGNENGSGGVNLASAIGGWQFKGVDWLVASTLMPADQADKLLRLAPDEVASEPAARRASGGANPSEREASVDAAEEAQIRLLADVLKLERTALRGAVGDPASPLASQLFVYKPSANSPNPAMRVCLVTRKVGAYERIVVGRMALPEDDNQWRVFEARPAPETLGSPAGGNGRDPAAKSTKPAATDTVQFLDVPPGSELLAVRNDGSGRRLAEMIALPRSTLAGKLDVAAGAGHKAAAKVAGPPRPDQAAVLGGGGDFRIALCELWKRAGWTLLPLPGKADVSDGVLAIRGSVGLSVWFVLSDDPGGFDALFVNRINIDAKALSTGGALKTFKIND